MKKSELEYIIGMICWVLIIAALIWAFWKLSGVPMVVLWV